MTAFETQLDNIKKQRKSDPAFCSDICNVCSGNKQECINALLIEVRRLNTKIKNLTCLLNPPKKSKSSDKVKGYIKVKKLSLQEVMPFIDNGKRLKISEDISVNTNSVRLRTFKNNTVCVSCGLVGTHFWAEKQRKDDRPHLNFYATNKQGQEVLMTKDHIIPKSKGGPDTSDNMQTMCTHCNQKKGNTLP